MISESSRSLYRGAQVVWYVVSIVEGILVIRFVLKLLQANPEAFFTSFIYRVSNIFVSPFVSVFQNTNVATSVFEWTTLVSMLVYWLLAAAIIKLFVMSKSVSAAEADQRLAE